MSQLIKGRAVTADAWLLLRDATALADVPAAGSVLVPLVLWAEARGALSRGVRPRQSRRACHRGDFVLAQ